MSKSLPQGHPPVTFGRIGVLIVNLGTPDGTDYWSMRRYLKEFLWDKRVIEVPRLIWWFILNLVILVIRPARKGRDYASIWNNTLNESPLKTITRGQCQALQQRLGDRAIIAWGMRYGNPSIPRGLDDLRAQGCDRILIVPLYPQYAAATSATVCDKAFDHLKTMRWQPFIRIAPAYHDDPVYIAALAHQVQDHLSTLPVAPQKLIATFHGIPERYLRAGDPYHCHCQKTGRLLRQALNWPEADFLVTFQSRFGREPWLQPYTDHTVAGLAKAGVTNIAITAPGFVADCLETLEELDVENRHIFMAAGGHDFTYIPCLNDTPHGVDVLEHIIHRELKGWLPHESH
ncbi:MAG: ferrochelatase [Pseudomonadota bacterium]